MQFALVEGAKSEPLPGLRGFCRACGMPMIAKCGRHKIWHWAHKSRLHCDPWWEPETEWHRAWKNRFPKEWQEVVHFDPVTSEKHIADVKTGHGLAVEFQHSVMDLDELKSREQFYMNMVWIVDGCRGELDASYFGLSLGQQISENPTVYSFQWWGRSKMFENWVSATKPVFVDFGDKVLWRLLLFNPKTKKGAVGPIGREQLVDDLAVGNPLAQIVRKADGTAPSSDVVEPRQEVKQSQLSLWSVS